MYSNLRNLDLLLELTRLNSFELLPDPNPKLKIMPSVARPTSTPNCKSLLWIRPEVPTFVIEFSRLRRWVTADLAILKSKAMLVNRKILL
jgi:hypothetical protein